MGIVILTVNFSGNVYNVTAYMDYHPGGWDELIKGAGKDATNLFNNAHRYNSPYMVILPSLVKNIEACSCVRKVIFFNF